MKLRFLFLFWALLGWLYPVYAQDSACNMEEGAVVNSLTKLPYEVQELLGRSKHDLDGIADVGEKFNSGDVIASSSVPMRRLVSGIAGTNCIRLVVEHGGSGYGKTQLEFERLERGWIQVKSTAVTGRKPWSPNPTK